MKKVVLFFTLCVYLVHAQEDTAGYTQPLLPGATDTVTMYEVLTPKPTDSTINAEDQLTQEATVEKGEMIFNNGFTISIAWAFGGSSIVDSWVSNEKQYQEDVSDYYDTLVDSTSTTQLSVLEEATHQVVSFPIKLGYLHRINNRVAFGGDVGYIYNGKGTSFIVEEFQQDSLGLVDSTIELFRYKTHLQHHLLQVGFSFEYLLIPDYFSIDKVARAGFSVNVSYIPLSLYISNSNYDSLSFGEATSSHTKMRGMGAGWGFTVFGEKELSEKTAGRLYLGYNGALRHGFEDHDKIIGSTSKDKLTEVDHMFQLGLTLLVGKKKEVVADETSDAAKQ